MSSKQDILARVRQHAPTPTPLPDLDADWITYDDPVAHFAEVLKTVGGTSLRVSDPAAIRGEIEALPQFAEAKRIVCTVPGLELGNVDLATVTDPHTLADIDLAILPGEFAVAENGAVWVTDRELSQRVIYFIAQHVVLVVSAAQMVHNMHQAYERLSFEQPGYGLFISGPSKTADIEQSLVIGAHGPRSLRVLLTD